MATRMVSETPPLDRSDVIRALGRVAIPELEPHRPIAESSVTNVGDGVNDVFTVVPGESREEQFVVKFGTYSKPGHLRASVAAYRVVDAFTDLPVPSVHAFEPGDEELPPFVVMEHLPGTTLAEGFHDENATNPGAVRVLGEVIDAFAQIPEDATDGYGFVRRVEWRGERPRAVAKHDDCAKWLVAYANTFYENPPDHEALRAVAPRVSAYLRTHRDRLPATPTQSIVVTDLSPQNLLSPDGRLPESTDELTGVIDLERAKLGPVEFTAINTEYLLTRYLSDPKPIRDALYDPLPFGPDVPARDLYRVIAMGRSVGRFPFTLVRPRKRNVPTARGRDCDGTRPHRRVSTPSSLSSRTRTHRIFVPGSLSTRVVSKSASSPAARTMPLLSVPNSSARSRFATTTIFAPKSDFGTNRPKLQKCEANVRDFRRRTN